MLAFTLEDLVVDRGSHRLSQFSVRWLLIGVAVVGIGLAAATSASRGWALGLLIVFHLILPISIVFSIYLTGERRAFWIGVVVFNLWTQLYSGEVELFGRNPQREGIAAILDHYVTAPLVGLQQHRVELLANQRVQREMAALPHLAQQMTPADLAKAKAEFVPVIEAEFQAIVTTGLLRLLMILASMAGGCLACWVFRRGDPDRTLTAC